MGLALTGCGGQSTQPAQEKQGTPAAETKTYTMRIGYATINDTQDYAGHRFKEQVEAASNGRIKVELYPGSQLGTNQKVVDSVQNGTIEGSFQPTAFLGGFAPILTTGDLPYLWPDQHVMLDILNNTEIGAEFRKVAQDKGVVIVGFVNQGTKHIVANFPVNSVKDLSGKKFRVMGAPVLVDMIKFWGGSAVPMAFSEIYTALQQRTVDAIEQTMELTLLNKYYEAAPYILLTSHGQLPEAIMINANWYNNLPQDLQKIISDVGQSVYKNVAKFCDESNAAALEKMKQSSNIKVVVPSKDVLDGFKSASLPTYDKFIKDVPGAQKFVDGFKSEIAKRSQK
jgi:C4-dicarboxylate-binding protein DctP